VGKAERLMEYMTNQDMGRFKRFISNMKDAIAYFGISALWRGRIADRVGRRCAR